MVNFLMLMQFIYPLCLLLVGILLSREENKFPKIAGYIIMALSVIDIIFKIWQITRSFRVV